MPALEAALFSYLTNDGTIAALVDARIYPFRLPEGCVLPAISWQRISAARTYTHDSFEDTAAWVRARVQFSCWSNTPLEAIKVGEAVLLALSGYDGDMAGQYIGSSQAEFELDDYQSPVKLYRRLVDFMITYEETDLVGS